uniref:Uncharacterized protein n=1 Tax=Cannabis sativa TaxID=3483 RepID=A0A803QV81_CANSA
MCVCVCLCECIAVVMINRSVFSSLFPPSPSSPLIPPRFSIPLPIYLTLFPCNPDISSHLI